MIPSTLIRTLTPVTKEKKKFVRCRGVGICGENLLVVLHPPPPPFFFFKVNIFVCLQIRPSRFSPKCLNFSSAQFSPLTDRVVGGTWGTIRQRSSSSLFIGMSLWAGTSTLTKIPCTVLPNWHRTLHGMGCPLSCGLREGTRSRSIVLYAAVIKSSDLKMGSQSFFEKCSKQIEDHMLFNRLTIKLKHFLFFFHC